MITVTSSDGTIIAFDRLGEGPPVIPADSLGPTNRRPCEEARIRTNAIARSESTTTINEI